MKNKSACRTSGKSLDLSDLAVDSGVVDGSARPSLSAFDGDLLHKQDLRSYGLLPSDSLFLDLIQQKNQASYLRAFYPDKVPSGNPSEHSLASLFEDAYFREITFRAEYIVRVSRGYCG